MGKAFRCDSCGEFREGDPDKRLYEQDTNRQSANQYTHVIDLCENCWAEFAIGFEEE